MAAAAIAERPWLVPSPAIITRIPLRNHHHHHHHRHPPDTPLSAAGFDVDNNYSSSHHHDWAYHEHDHALRPVTASASKPHRRVLAFHPHRHRSARTPPRRSSHGSGVGIALPRSVAVPVGRAYRSVSLPGVGDKAMASIAVESIAEESVPSSPPELSYSKSSKSSSSLTSDDELCVNGQEGGLSKHGHFEDVVLEEEGGSDDREDSNLPPDSRPTLRRPPPKSLTTGAVPRRRSGTSPPPRSLTNARQAKYPSLQGAVTGVLRDQSLNLPSGRSMQRAVSSPTLTHMQSQALRFPSRSPSPNKLYAQSHCSSPQTVAGSTPKASYESQGSAPRRPSWQPSRRSTKELEAEYNDEDEDVPDDAILENVPISPLPGHYALPLSPNPLPNGHRSATPSPNRRPGPHASMHSANIPKGAKRPNGMSRSPKYPHRPKMPHANTTAAIPMDPRSRQFRSRSWTEHLNYEARELSQKLEEYAERQSQGKRSAPNSGSNSAASSPPRSSWSKPVEKRSSHTGIPSIPTGLPPLQKGNIMIDPLPISKEKEAVLSRTRPSWLPPKDPQEEKKHLKEFQQMMAKAAEAEKKRAVREQTHREGKEEMQGSIARIWEQHVLPNWDAVVKESRTRELWWRGVTPSARGEVWSKAIGNELELSTVSFDAALARAHALEAKIADMSEEEKADSKEAAWMDAIARDVPNTFPELKVYHNSRAPLQQSLLDVLKAYTMYRSDVGYVYGTHLVAGIVCLQLPAAEAFVLLANILNRPLPLAFLVHDQPAMGRAYELTLQTLKYKYARLHDHLTSPQLDIKPEEFLDPIYRCLFAYNLSAEHVSRIWDIYVFEGDRALVRAAVAVLAQLESKLYGSREDILQLIGWMNLERWPVAAEDGFIEAMREAGKVDRRVSA
ncbi:hypothetical protein BST61_g9719 [Cercospora zeina]